MPCHGVNLLLRQVRQDWSNGPVLAQESTYLYEYVSEMKIRMSQPNTSVKIQKICLSNSTVGAVDRASEKYN